MKAAEKAMTLVLSGICATTDEAAHFLVDSGEINEAEHAALLSPMEWDRVYGNNTDQSVRI